MPKLIIDEREIEVPAGTKVIEAAERLGIMIPRFCYHPALGSVGACRMCAVSFVEGPVKGVQMSCMVDAQEGMKVATADAESTEFRRFVVECLMLNHPHDCPVCDEGGHCLLQDMTASSGHGIRRYRGRKRTYADQELGPLVEHEMNRCIHCYRCARFYQEITGYRDLGAMGIGNRTYFGRTESGTLESPFSGNLVDLCPTGVFTDKPSRYVGRRWDYQRRPTVCLHCSLGCNLVTSVRYRQVARQEAHFNPAVNGWFVCDRGRHGFHYASLAERPRQARVQSERSGFDDALAYARERLAAVQAAAGPRSVALVGSARSSLETLAAAAALARKRGWRGPAVFADEVEARTVAAAVARLEPGLAVSLRQVEQADCVLVVGADALHEAPMLALAIRQAARSGAAVVVVDPRAVGLSCAHVHVPVGPAALPETIGRLLRAALPADSLAGEAGRFLAALPPESAKAPETVRTAAACLSASRRPVVVCGTAIAPPGLVGLAADAALLLRAAGKEAGLFYLLPGANAAGAALLADPADSVRGVLQAAADGSVKALVVVESDPLGSFPDRALLDAALARVELLVAVDYLDSPTSRRAGALLPSQTVYEAGGTFVNQEGRAQVSPCVFAGGSSVLETGAGDHPPRAFGLGLPGADPRPAWRILAGLAGATDEPDGEERPSRLRHDLAQAAPRHPALRELPAIPEEGLRLQLGDEGAARFEPLPPRPEPAPDELEVVVTERTFGTEELSGYSACLRALHEPPFVGLHPRDAATLGLREGDRVALRTPSGPVGLNVCCFADMAPGVVVIPRLRSAALPAPGGRFRQQDLRKA
jgi:NADH-quinone oxidoreductase subunit G